MAVPVFVGGAGNYALANNPLSVALDVGSTADRFVVAVVTDYATASTVGFSSATYNGVALTASSVFTGAGGLRVRLFWGTTSATGSNTFATSPDSDNIALVQALAFHTCVSASGEVGGGAASTALSLTLTSATGDLGVLLATNNAGATLTPTAPATEVVDAAIGGARGVAMTSPGATSLTIAGTMGSAHWLGAAISLAGPASGDSLMGAQCL